MANRVSTFSCSLLLLLCFVFELSLCSLEPECGKLHSKQAAEKGEWPWKVSIFLVEPPATKKFRCGANLISKDYIVTSARCVTLASKKIRFNVNNLEIVMGAENLVTRLDGPNLQTFKPSKVILHEKFDPIGTAYDMALIKLNRPAKFNEFVHPICLWEEDKDINSVIGKTGTISGYDVQYGQYLNAQDEIKVEPIETCQLTHPAFLIGFNLDRTLCAGSKRGTLTCPGQTGTGVYFRKSTDPEVWQLRALKSTALYNHGVGADCKITDYVLYADVAQYNEWIKDKIYNGNDEDLNEVTDTEENIWKMRGCKIAPTKDVPLIGDSESATTTISKDSPWNVAIYTLVGSNLKYKCGGTLISDHCVLTAAHCITETGTKDAIPLNKIQVYLGVSRLRELSGTTPTQFAAELIVHPDYNENNLDNDIGIIRFKTSVEFSRTIWPICLWDDEESFENLFNKYGLSAMNTTSATDKSKPQKGDHSVNANKSDKKPIVLLSDLTDYLQWIRSKMEE